ncbi:MAG: aromatic amino acid ammonia-lyase [Bacteroidales bacterium]|nr:aromatic amino acid ammonia-lyase [Bacteroidales bacterium]
MIIIGRQQVTLEDYYNILYNDVKIDISAEAVKRVNDCYNFLNDFHKNKVIYGINTGLGPMAQYQISTEDRINLQYNAIRSHCSGQGENIPDMYVKAAMISSLSSYLRGYSGIHSEVVLLLKELINRSIYPLVPEHGGVGASGDLVQLAHIALALIGEGEVSYKGNILPTKTVFEENNLKPITAHIREGLSLINGTYVMTGIGVVNLINAKNLLDWTVVASSIINEIVGSYNDYFSVELNDIKCHNGQSKIAEKIRVILKDSKLIRNREEHLFNKKFEEVLFKDKVQEYYSLRCVPQILGAVYDTYDYTEKVVLEEANSSCDNPVIDYKNENIFHGGNFHGDYVSFEMDKIKIATAKLSMLVERQINFLMNNKLNGKLPPFVNLGKLGVNFGMQGVQFTATSTVAENQTLSFPMYVHSIPNNNDNQDIVSMGTNSALLAKKVIENSFQVVSIELISLIQAIDYLECQNSLSSYTKSIYDELRKIVPKFVDDTTKHKDVLNIKNYIQSKRLNIISPLK